MKKLTLLLTTISLSVLVTKANVFTVSNNLAHPSTYTDIQSAITAASKGDTIYVLGSLTPYAGITISKFVNIFGPGFLPQKANSLTATVNSVEIKAGADSTVISGLIFQGIYFDANNTYYNLVIERNELTGELNFNGGPSTANNLRVLSNFFTGTTFIATNSNTFNNFLVENNVMVYNSGPFIINGFTSNTTIFKNNIFIDGVSGGNGTYGSIQQLYQVTFTNNIFIGMPFNFNNGNSVNYCTFDHNLAYLVSGSYGSDPFAFGNNSSFGNIWDQNPDFNNVNLTNALVTNDYSLQASSPSLKAASDGGQQGAFGGDPNASWALATMPALPYIVSFLLNTATVNAGGNINATIISKSHN